MLELKAIGEILNESFYIPSYQRGYKWDKQQVEDLLNDIEEFANKPKIKDEFYCLQPIVVLKYNDKYKVIDGQQRLTTIYIILKYLQNLTDEFDKLKEKCKEIENFFNIKDFNIEKIYTIEYETRSNDFLENKLSSGLNYDNPDFYYMSRAYQTIKDWFESKNKKLFLDTLLKQTKVIWYEVDNSVNEIDIFTRLNIGKIPLTNAELIKAMLLLDKKEYKSQIEFSVVWDKIELTLQNDEFWYFLSNDKKATTTIDLIFEVLAQKYKNEYNNDKEENQKIKFSIEDDKFSFYVFDKILKENKKSRIDIWTDTQEVYRYFIDWYNDREIYHKVGYLIKFDTNLVDLLGDYKDETKNEFRDKLNQKIKDSLNNLKVLEELSYGDNDIHKVLLLFNLETILQNTNSNSRFAFDKYKNESWDIEHIASQTDNINKKEWIKAIYQNISNKKISLDKLNKIEKKFDRFYSLVKNMLKIKELNEELKDNIGNLTLLNAKINRSYGNAFFPIKRAIIINKDSKGSFIPIATKNIFLKQYSKKLSDMMNWTDSDIKSYRENIYLLLEKYGVKNEKSRK